MTLVVQVLAPASLQQYIHRVGRTARGGKEGQALLMLLTTEEQQRGGSEGTGTAPWGEGATKCWWSSDGWIFEGLRVKWMVNGW